MDDRASTAAEKWLVGECEWPVEETVESLAELLRSYGDGKLEEAAKVVDDDPYHSSTHEELVAKIRNLKEKP